MDLSYQEKQDRLNTRIRAHKLFANFDIADWIERFLAAKPRHKILDLGCGNGNHFGLYLGALPQEGQAIGVDREKSLVDEATRNYSGDKRARFMVGSMDDPLPFDGGTFDLCFSNFAIYNASDPKRTLQELKRVMTSGAELVLIGPTANNAIEIYEYNERLTGTKIDPITLVRTDRLRQEIVPIVKQVFGASREEVVNSFLTFPDQDEFIRYFRATMLYEEGAEKTGKTMDEMRAACAGSKNIVLSKEMLAVIAKKE